MVFIFPLAPVSCQTAGVLPSIPSCHGDQGHPPEVWQQARGQAQSRATADARKDTKAKARQSPEIGRARLAGLTPPR